MKRTILIAILVIQAIFLMSATWETDFEKAKAEAKAEHKYILLSFSGSDWCLPCIKMEKTIFSSASFTQFADSNLIAVKADFPRLKKNKQAEALIKQNEWLAEIYNKEGHFPLTLLLNADGKVIKTWDGYPDATPEDFIGQIKNAAK